MEVVKTFFLYKCNLSVVLLYLIVFFTEWFQIEKEFTTPLILFEEISPQEINKCLQKLYLLTRKRDGRSVIFVRNYLTVLL